MRKKIPAIIFAFLCLLSFGVSSLAQDEVQTWEVLDKKLKPEIFQLNVGMKLHLSGGRLAYIADLSPKYHYPIFSAGQQDEGYRVVGFGTSFPIKTNRSDKNVFVTNRHVVDSSEQIVHECERFYAAMRLYAEQTAGVFGNVDQRFNELLQIINLSRKKNMNASERTTYQTIADGIWDTYDTYLSVKADANRQLFAKYLQQAQLQSEIVYFLHAPGPVAQKPLEAKIYKVAKVASDPDLAILFVDGPQFLPLDFDPAEPSEGQEIQVIGYPTASDQIDADAGQYYAPTFNTGRISRVSPHMLQVDAPITTGNSGGPVVSQKGKVLGVVAVRALSARGGELPNFGGAITNQSLKSFAPELFSAPGQP
jgi:S1-C subfamily serine protease